MAFESHHFDPDKEEQDFLLWAAEFDLPYEIGTQGNVDQPRIEMTPDRIVARADLWAKRMRELGMLPAIMDDEERALHITVKQLAKLPEEEKAHWYHRASEWLSTHPNATLYNLIDRPPKLP